ncbi:hypothetical protein HPB50_002309 [Hyalomma asiaticum]|uniref:Uncharacterized protein n=1 Tax=Hyalomma asiaticum TaxID=266040 RepID=A0ACB7SJQ1_HYAAI|nr:hypothetical protein HPB50_002309 [Hyalomma asiaticum]
MAPILESCRELLVELGVFLWCTVVRFVFALWFSWKKPVPLPAVADKLLLRSATSLAADIRNGKVKSVDVVSAYIRRIREVQPILNAVVEDRFEEALEDAKEVDKFVGSGTMSASQMSTEKPLLGLPFTSKNSIAIKGMRQDAGSLYWHGRRAAEDAPSVAFLKAAGAIPLALTNVPELCMWDDSQNLVDGCTRNPHDTRRSPGGSSGVVPNAGLLPDVGENLRQFNCVGPMTRFAEDLPLLLRVLAGSDTDVFKLNEKVNLKTLKLYYMDTEGSLYISRVTADARRAVRRVVQYLKGAHGLQERRLHLPEERFGMFLWFRVLGVMDPQPLAEFYWPGGFNTLVELLRHLVGAGRITLAALASCIIAWFCSFSSKQKGEAYVAAVERARDRLEATLGDDGVLVLPATTNVAPFQNQDLAFLDSSSLTALFNLFKVPVAVCPVMRSAENLPLCVQVVAKRGNDRLCLAVAREIENRFGGWIDPSAKLKGRV